MATQVRCAGRRPLWVCPHRHRRPYRLQKLGRRFKFQKRDPLHRDLAAQEPLRRPGTGILRRRDDRRVDQRPGPGFHAACHLPYLGNELQGHKKQLPQIAHELSVDGVVEGVVQREGNQVRIGTQLIDADRPAHLGAHLRPRHDQRARVAAEVAQTITEEIRTNLTPQEQARLTR